MAEKSEHKSSGMTARHHFASELRRAIKASGLSLDRIQYRLRNRGAAVSITALSYWQSGKRQPERARSISAVRALEQILDRPDGSLVNLLPPPRPRGPARRSGVLAPAGTVRFAREVLRPLLERLDAAAVLDEHLNLQLAGLHDRCEIAADGGQRTVTSRAVFEANADDQRRWLLVYAHDDAGTPPPVPYALRNCTVGRTAIDRRHGIMAAELLFDRAAHRGETYLIEYLLAYAGPPFPRCGNTRWREFRRPVREYLLEVQFGVARQPARCWQYQSMGSNGSGTRRELTVDGSGGVHAVALDFGPGVFGIAWE